MRAPAACLFDLDGLLLNTEPLHGQAWREAAAHFGTNLNGDQLLELRGRRRLDCARQVITWMKTPISCDQLLAIQQPIARRLLPDAGANPGAEDLIACCQHLGVPMALVTSSSADSVELKISNHPWIRQIGTRVLGSDPDLKAGKPAPDPFLLAAERLGVAADACWAFEDSVAGSHAAIAAGCQVWVLDPDSRTSARLGSAEADAWTRINSLHDAVEPLRACNQKLSTDD